MCNVMGVDFFAQCYKLGLMKSTLPYIALFLVTAILLERGLNHIGKEYSRLEKVKIDIAQSQVQAQARKENLERQIMSQSDPTWTLLTLIRVLGVIPEGQKKVYFKP